VNGTTWGTLRVQGKQSHRDQIPKPAAQLPSLDLVSLPRGAMSRYYSKFTTKTSEIYIHDGDDLDRPGTSRQRRRLYIDRLGLRVCQESREQDHEKNSERPFVTTIRITSVCYDYQDRFSGEGRHVIQPASAIPSCH
jgi:hypothetical protein